jgi:hypothetical protein
MSSKDTGITSKRPAPPSNPLPEQKEKEPEPMPAATSADPLDSAVMLWGLRLWLLCALLIVSFAVINYLLNWYAR